MWCSPVPAPSTDTRADPASARRAAEAARGRVGRAGGPLWCGPNLGAWGLFRSQRLPTYSRLIAHNCSVTDHERACYCAPPVRLLRRRPPPKGRASRAARAAERPAAPVRLGRGGEPPGLISPWCPFPSRVRQAPALDRHVQPRRRHGRPLRPQRRRRDGEDATPATSNGDQFACADSHVCANRFSEDAWGSG